VRRWEAELLAWHASAGLTNARTEATTNLRIKEVKRVAHGFRNFDNYRVRLYRIARRLAHCTCRETQRPHPAWSRREPDISRFPWGRDGRVGVFVRAFPG
jgi:hypothetical protein